MQLNNVKVIVPTVAQIEYKGVVYVESTEDAAAGDIVRISKECLSYITDGAYYEVTKVEDDEAYFADDDGDSYGIDDLDEKPTVFKRAVKAASPAYREVDRDAKVGERIKIVAPFMSGGSYSRGDEFEVTRVDSDKDVRVMIRDESRLICRKEFVVLEPVTAAATEPPKPALKVGDSVRINLPGGQRTKNGRAGVTNSEVGKVTRVSDESVTVTWPSYGQGWLGVASELDVVEPLKPARLTVGDYAKVIAKVGGHNYAIGEIIRITVDDGDGKPYRGEKASSGSVGNWLYTREVEPATREDFERKQPLKQTDAKRLKVGEYAKIIGGAEGNTGDIVKVTEDDGTDVPFRVEHLNGSSYGWKAAENVVRATVAEVSAARYAIRIGDFRNGDYAVIDNATEENTNPTARSNAGVYVTVTEEGPGDYRGLCLRKADGSLIGYANADALRKVTKEEYEVAMAVGDFRLGDKARLLSTSAGCLAGFTLGETVTITSLNSGGRYRLEVQGVSHNVKGYTDAVSLLKITPEVAPQAEATAKWSAIGREIDEIRKGDIVKVENPYGGRNGRGEIGFALTDGTTGNVRVGTPKNPEGVAGMNAVTLVTPVEQRFDKSAGAAA